jgi:hypothetical protein
MSAQSEPEIVLYDLACTKNICFSPVVWRIRLMLNYKRIPYRTIFLEFPDIEPTLKGLYVLSHFFLPSFLTSGVIDAYFSQSFLVVNSPIPREELF